MHHRRHRCGLIQLVWLQLMWLQLMYHRRRRRRRHRRHRSHRSVLMRGGVQAETANIQMFLVRSGLIAGSIASMIAATTVSLAVHMTHAKKASWKEV